MARMKPLTIRLAITTRKQIEFPKGKTLHRMKLASGQRTYPLFDGDGRQPQTRLIRQPPKLAGPLPRRTRVHQ